nr:hypothetical protein [Tanacetum cinerariifolium]
EDPAKNSICHDFDGLADQRKKANLSLVNLGGVLEGYNEEDNNITFFGSQFTGNILFYENVDPAKKDEDVSMGGDGVDWDDSSMVDGVFVGAFGGLGD